MINLEFKLSRRSMLGTTASGILLLGSGNAHAQIEIEPPLVPGAPKSQLSSEQIAAQYYQRNLEKKYGFSLLILKEFIQKLPRLSPLMEVATDQEWSMNQLALVDEIYGVFPDSFADPRRLVAAYNQPQALVLSNTKLTCVVACSTKEEFPAIRISEKRLKYRVKCIETLAHEQGHILAPEVWRSPSPEMDQIFDGSYAAAHPEMEAKLIHIQQGIQMDLEDKGAEAITPLQAERKTFFKRMRYGLSNDDRNPLIPSEFVANLSTFYIHGKGYFHHYLGEMYTNDQVKALYDFCQRRFYGNLEYDHLPIAA